MNFLRNIFVRRLSARGLDAESESLGHDMADRVILHLGLQKAKNPVARLSKLEPKWRYIAPLFMYESEVANGGHFQFFWNTDGSSNELVRSGLKYFQCDEFLEIYEEALEIYDSRPHLKSAKNSSGEEMREAFAANSEEDPYDKQDMRYYDTVPGLDEVLSNTLRARLSDYR